MKFKNILLFLLVISIIVISFLPYQLMVSKAEEDNSQYLLNAVLYDTNQYGGGTGTALTEEGSQVNNWQYDTSKYLQIDPMVPVDGNTYVVTVKLPQEFYIVTSELVTQSGYQKVEFTKNESVQVNTDLTYDLNKYSGTAEFTMNYMGISGTLQLEIRYDNVLWDKQSGSYLTPEGIKPIEVILSKKDSSGVKEDLRKVSIDKATAGSKTQYNPGMGWSLGTETPGSQITAYRDQNVKLSISYATQANKIYMYYPKMTLTVNLPYYTDSSGNKHYLPVNESTIKLGAFQNPLYTIDTSKVETDGIFEVNFKNAYFSDARGKLFEIQLGPLNEELQELSQNSFVFSGAKCTVTVDGKNGNKDIKLFDVSVGTITYEKETLEKVVLTSSGKSVTITERPVDAVSEMGGFYLENTGTGDSCQKTIYVEFDNKNTNLIKVTTINTFADTLQQYIDITYTLVDDNGDRVFLDENGNKVTENTDGAVGEWVYSLKNQYYNTTTAVNLQNMLTRAKLPEAHRKYYFKTLKYKIESIKSGAKLFRPSANATLVGAGNFFGYVSESAVNGKTATSKIEITSLNTQIANLTKTVTTTLQSLSNPTYMISNVTMNKTLIGAGESVNLSGKLQSVNYPYGNSMWLKGIKLGIILPKGVTVNEQAVTIKTGKKVNIENFEVSTQEIADGNILWVIELPSDVYFGYVTESLTELNSGSYIDFSLQLDTSYTMNNFTLYTGDMLLLSGHNQTNSGSRYVCLD